MNYSVQSPAGFLAALTVTCGAVLAGPPLWFEPIPSRGAPTFFSRAGPYSLRFRNGEVEIRSGNRRLRVHFPGARRVSPELEEELPGKTNYLLGPDPRRWRTNVSQYRRIRYRNLYPGTDLVFYGNGGQMEFDWIVAPGANPAHVKLEFDRPVKTALDASGNLKVGFGGNDVVFRHPAAYQNDGVARRAVEASYVTHDRNRVAASSAHTIGTGSL